MSKINIIPLTFKQANSYVVQYHRHRGACAGCKFCLGLVHGDCLVGVAICGRPVSRHLDDGFTIEINRLCTDGTYNACSKLYSACVKVAKAMGYKKVITYTLISEPGASLKASNFLCMGEAGETHWTGKRYKKDKGIEEKKIRWEYHINDKL